MQTEKGKISVRSENIFPIIKKWLYSDKDIFLRELISNAIDAISKLKRLDSLGETELQEGEALIITVAVDKEKKIITVTDNGIGMTGDEVKKYINQVAFSGAEDFIKMYEKEKIEGHEIIGHFGLGFYSSFMVAEHVEIDTLSYADGAEAVKWQSHGGADYDMSPSGKLSRGTTVTLHLLEDSEEFLKIFKVREILNKYCGFLPVEIFVEEVGAEDKDKEEEISPVNDISPLWIKKPSEVTDEEYKEFYQKVFMDYNEPLFWIHLNVDFPFRLKGILYFPRLNNRFDTIEGKIKLYNNQVFVADNIKEVIPEFLLLLKGVIDCPDLPLNVSRSFLQNDGYVKRISRHITKKVADKLKSIYKNDRDAYNKYWEDINPFVKFGCMRDDKFYDSVKDILVFKDFNDNYISLSDYLEQSKETNENQVFYVSDATQQARYIKLLKEHGINAIYLDSPIDNNFISFLEMKESGVKYLRVDSEMASILKDEDGVGADAEKVEKVFKTALGKEDMTIKVENLKSTSVPAMILLSEQSRRMKEMSQMWGNDNNMPGMFKDEETLVINGSNALVKAIIEMDEGEKRDMMAGQIYDLAQISHKTLDADSMEQFLTRTTKMMEMLIKE